MADPKQEPPSGGERPVDPLSPKSGEQREIEPGSPEVPLPSDERVAREAERAMSERLQNVERAAGGVAGAASLAEQARALTEECTKRVRGAMGRLREFEASLRTNEEAARSARRVIEESGVLKPKSKPLTQAQLQALTGSPEPGARSAPPPGERLSEDEVREAFRQGSGGEAGAARLAEEQRRAASLRSEQLQAMRDEYLAQEGRGMRKAEQAAREPKKEAEKGAPPAKVETDAEQRRRAMNEQLRKIDAEIAKLKGFRKNIGSHALYRIWRKRLIELKNRGDTLQAKLKSAGSASGPPPPGGTGGERGTGMPPQPEGGGPPPETPVGGRVAEAERGAPEETAPARKLERAPEPEKSAEPLKERITRYVKLSWKAFTRIERRAGGRLAAILREQREKIKHARLLKREAKREKAPIKLAKRAKKLEKQLETLAVRRQNKEREVQEVNLGRIVRERDLLAERIPHLETMREHARQFAAEVRAALARENELRGANLRALHELAANLRKPNLRALFEELNRAYADAGAALQGARVYLTRLDREEAAIRAKLPAEPRMPEPVPAGPAAAPFVAAARPETPARGAEAGGEPAVPETVHPPEQTPAREAPAEGAAIPKAGAAVAPEAEAAVPAAGAAPPEAAARAGAESGAAPGTEVSPGTGMSDAEQQRAREQHRAGEDARESSEEAAARVEAMRVGDPAITQTREELEELLRKKGTGAAPATPEAVAEINADLARDGGAKPAEREGAALEDEELYQPTLNAVIAWWNAKATGRGNPLIDAGKLCEANGITADALQRKLGVRALRNRVLIHFKRALGITGKPNESQSYALTRVEAELHFWENEFTEKEEARRILAAKRRIKRILGEEPEKK